MIAVQTSVADWLQIIRGEFIEIPGLCLTRRQFERLWGLDPATCDAVLDALVASKFLRRTLNDAYTRAEVRQ